MFYSELTNFNSLYKNVYWGCFETRSGVMPSETIIKNRNKFAIEYKITKNIQIKADFYRHYPYLDHCEAYKSEFGEIFFISSISLKLDFNPLDLGFHKIYNLYSETTATYISAFKDSKEMNEFINNYRRT